MSLHLCRLCLCVNNLIPIFLIEEENERCAKDLWLATGLKITPNDGFPQQICSLCTNLVNSSLNLRNQSQISELKLIEWGYKRQDITPIIQEEIIELDFKRLKTPDHIIKNQIKNVTINESLEDIYEFLDCTSENNRYNVTVELGNVQEENDTLQNIEQSQNILSIHPEKKIEETRDLISINRDKNKNENKVTDIINIRPEKNKKTRGKSKREDYLNLVDGALDPNGPVKCKVCKKTVSKWSCFVNHAKLHLGFKFVCEYCAKSFISSTQLNRHCRSYHSKQRELACRYCGYLALDNAQLGLHERKVHTGERPYICDVCGSSYHSRKCLIQHLESHLNVATVKCPICNKLFKSSRHLSRHRYSAHPSVGGGRFSGRSTCQICTRDYSTKYLRAHMMRYHNDG